MVHSCNQFFSHPNICLKDHLKDVGLLCKFYVEKSGVRSPELLSVAELMGRGHDLAKYTEFFQEYLQGGKRKDESTHSKLSATLSSWLVNVEANDPFLALVAFWCVASHHGNLKSLSEIRDIIEGLSIKDYIIRSQVESIKKNFHLISNELEELGLEKIKEFIVRFEDCLKSLQSVLKKSLLEKEFKSELKERMKDYFTVMLLFSSLIDADKKDAGQAYEKLHHVPRSFKLPSNLIQFYREKEFRDLEPSTINKLREKLYSIVEKRLEEILNEMIDRRVVTLTAPTGTGKTILGFNAALKLRSRVPEAPYPKIIYCLPYINIIEQTHSTIEKILSTKFENIPVTLLLKHHHLFFPSNGAEHEVPVDTLLLLADSWESEIIVTTFVQFFHTLIGCKNASLKKLHNIANSIIILDEVQTIPLEYWRLVKEVLSHLVNNLNVTVIFMTATMPLIFREELSLGGVSVNTVELIPDYRSYFMKLDRMIIKPYLKSEMTADELVEFFFSNWRKNTSAMIVLNTIKTSKKIYEKIKDRLREEGVCYGLEKMKNEVKNNSKVLLLYLSTSIIPKDRKRRIELMKRKLWEGRAVILISTQVVEAGVDLDFAMAIRDLGPLDSIVQVGGRCNRGWRSDKGNLYVVKLIDENGKPDANKVYGTILPSITSKLLSKREIILEHELPDLIEEYYKEISDRMHASDHEESEKLLKLMENLNYRELADFSLIREEPKVPIFIEFNDEAKRILERFKEVWEKRGKILEKSEAFEYKAELRKIRVELENYIVNVWRNDDTLLNLKGLKEIAPGTGIIHVPSRILEAYYDEETGFKSGEESSFFL